MSQSKGYTLIQPPTDAYISCMNPCMYVSPYVFAAMDLRGMGGLDVAYTPCVTLTMTRQRGEEESAKNRMSETDREIERNKDTHTHNHRERERKKELQRERLIRPTLSPMSRIVIQQSHACCRLKRKQRKGEDEERDIGFALFSLILLELLSYIFKLLEIVHCLDFVASRLIEEFVLFCFL